MNKAVAGLLTAAILTCSQPAYAAPCEWNKGVWTQEHEGETWLLYLDDNGDSSRRNVFLEQWREDKLQARVYGNHVCSQGVSICWFVIEQKYFPYTGEYDPEPDTLDEIASVNPVFIDENGDDLAEWITTGALAQELYRAETDHVEFQNGASPENGPVAPFANAFKFDRCREFAIPR